jgi:Trk K+ transport system NAD-binding subunit
MAKKKKQIGIIGLGIFGTNVVKALSKAKSIKAFLESNNCLIP